MGVDTSMTILAGVSNTLLNQWLTQAQQAYADLMTGGKPIMVTYSQGDGSNKSVTYTRTDAQQLTMWIKQLQTQLGIICGRRPMRPVFNGR